MRPRQHKTRNGRRPGRAFTLVELVLVTVIVAIFASIAVPRYANFVAQQRADAAAGRIKTDLALARRQARFSSTARTVTFDVGADSYTLVGMEDPDHPAQTYQVNIAAEPYNARITSVDFNGDTQLTFDGYGTPVDTGGTPVSGKVTVQAGDYQRVVTVDVNGRIVIGTPPP